MGDSYEKIQPKCEGPEKMSRHTMGPFRDGWATQVPQQRYVMAERMSW